MKNALRFFYLHALFLLFSCIPILSKLAGEEHVFSAKFFLYLGGVFVLLVVYALLWQKILKVFPLIVAFSNKAITIVWGILFGRFIFDEEITIGMICGAIIITAGIIVISLNQTQKKQESDGGRIPTQPYVESEGSGAPVQAASTPKKDEGDDTQCI